MSVDLEPLAVYDVNEGSYRYEFHGELRGWAAAHGIDVDLTYRVEIHLLDCLFARVFQHDLNEDGELYVDPGTLELAVRAPYDRVIDAMPPVGPWEAG